MYGYFESKSWCNLDFLLICKLQKELCFGGANHLELRVMENSPATPVVYLGSLPGMCGTLKVNYNVSISEGTCLSLIHFYLALCF